MNNCDKEKMKQRKWNKIDSEIIYQTKWMSIREDLTIAPEGNKLTYSYLDFNNGVIIVPVDDDGGIYFVEQHRYPPDVTFYELPGGHMESDDPIKDAKKELFEETGICAKVFKHLGKVHPLPSHIKPYANIILAEGLDIFKLGTKQQDNDEAIASIKKFSKDEIIKRMYIGKEESNDANDAQTSSGSICTGLNLSALMFYWIESGTFQ